MSSLERKSNMSFGGMRINEIVRMFKQLGWEENPEGLAAVDRITMMIRGNNTGAMFWHVNHGRNYYHKDTLELFEDKLLRHCPAEGEVLVFSKPQPDPKK